MIWTGRKLFDWVTTQVEDAWVKVVLVVVFGTESATDLELLTDAPGPDTAGMIESEGMVRAADNSFDVLESRDEHRLFLLLDGLSLVNEEGFVSFGVLKDVPN